MISKREANLLRSVTETTSTYYIWIAALSCITLWGLYAYIHQVRQGLIVTGMRDQTSWGLYITDFVFFIGISHAGTLISAVLRVTDAGWRRPITRLAEGITVFALCIGGPMVIIDMGRPDRMLNLFIHGRIQSSIFWDVLGVSTYLTGCIIYLYLPMIPDLGFLAQREEFGKLRRKFYRALSLGWTGTEAEQHLLEKCVSILAVIIIPLAISVHTVVSWIFAMTLRPGWNSSIFGPYFVVGAIYSGAAGVVLSMYLVRRAFHLEDYIEPLHFRNLGLLLLTFCMLYLYFNVNEYLTTGYKVEGPEKLLLHELFFGDFSTLFWTVQSMVIFIPMVMMIAVLGMKRLQRFTPPVLAVASFLVVVGAWAKRYLIIIPTLSTPYLPNAKLPYDWLHYRPTWVEWSITAGAVAVFLLIYMLFAKLFPMVSIWETREDDAERQLVEQRRKEDAEPSVSATQKPGPQRLGTIPTATIILAVCMLFGATHAWASEPRESIKPKATVLTIDWRAEDTSNPKTNDAQAGGSRSAGSLLDRFFGWHPAEPIVLSQDPPKITVTATLLDANGQPLMYQVVSLSLKTSFGSLFYGNRPTNAQGKAEFLLQDRRYGRYSVEGVFNGGDKFASTHGVALVDFGPRSEPALPSEGVLITPYPTAGIALPFLFFYGTMWVVFFYVGYLIIWRLPQIRKQQAKSS
jgi:molybdopterin-containing oxidoreductase family membrane subunit